MTNEQARRSVSVTLAEIEQNELATAKFEILDDYFRPGSDAAEAWAIIDRIERKLFPAGMPR